MVDEKCDTLQAKAVEMVQYQYFWNVCMHAQMGKFKVVFAFFWWSTLYKIK